MGIRALAAGALADTVDRALAPDDPVAHEYERAAGFRALAAERGCSAASLAYRYALSLPDVATVVVGAKTRPELAECLAAAARPLAAEELEEIERACSPAAGAEV
jgi:aryl-alcohol dehydrogenase-like predicted oxidoreductase